MKSILKWPGGKERELPVIREHVPAFSGRYVEPFLGGGAVFFDIDAEDCRLNDWSDDLMNFYRCVRDGDPDLTDLLYELADEFSSLGRLADAERGVLLSTYEGGLSVGGLLSSVQTSLSPLARLDQTVFRDELRVNLERKLARSRRIEARRGGMPDEDRLANMEAALKSAYYMYVRHLLNSEDALSPGQRAAVFFFIREYCFSSMFRYNEHGQFNVPYGGISYNRKNFRRKVDYALSAPVRKKLAGAGLDCLDFEDFLERLRLTGDDFVFLDPPYDTEFSSYAGNDFDQGEQVRLRDLLLRTPARFMLLIKATDFIYGLYREDFRVLSFDKRYSVSFMNRNDRDVEHLVVMNY